MQIHYYNYLKLKIMKEMFTTLAQAWKEDKKEFITSVLFLVFLFGFLYCSLWFAHIIGLK